jgi:hypothetical protein
MEEVDDAMEARGLKVNVKVMGSMEEIVKEKGTHREGRHCRSGRPALPPYHYT